MDENNGILKTSSFRGKLYCTDVAQEIDGLHYAKYQFVLDVSL